MDVAADRFTFEVGPPQPLDVGFRFNVAAQLAGKVFASVRLDVAARADEFAGDRDAASTRRALELGLVRSTEVLPLVRHVFESRGTHPVPVEIPNPPAAWTRDYAEEAAATALGARTLDEALSRLRDFWRNAQRR